MANDSQISYTVNLSETGIQTEVYLPKNSYFQGTLYVTLTKGFNHNHVKRTLVRNIDEIKNLMDKFTVPLISKGLEEKRIEAMKQIFWGYSMYEVDGVFCSFTNRKARIDEERSQVIRMMFLPDIKDIQEALIKEKAIKRLRHASRSKPLKAYLSS